MKETFTLRNQIGECLIHKGELHQLRLAPYPDDRFCTDCSLHGLCPLLGGQPCMTLCPDFPDGTRPRFVLRGDAKSIETVSYQSESSSWCCTSCTDWYD